MPQVSDPGEATLENLDIRRMLKALERGEFTLNYQPQVSTKTGAVVGAEALIRWQHPSHGLLVATRFLGALQDLRFAMRVGEWAVAKARRDIEQWRADGFVSVPVAVNIHPEHLARPEFASRFLTASAGLLNIEITESDGPVEKIAASLRVLRDAGVKVALDDFGIGYSSFGRLVDLPVDILKVDTSLVSVLTRPRDPAHLLRIRRTLSTLVTLSHICPFTTIAEGVETPADFAAVRELGFDQSQGYLHGQAMSVDAFRRFLCQAAAPMDGTIRCPASVARAQAERPGARGVQPSVRP